MTVLLAEPELVEFVRSQRWFGAKSEDLTGARLVDHALLREEPPLADALVDLRYGSGNRDLYQLVLGGGDHDLVADPDFGRDVVRLVREGATVATAHGHVSFETSGGIPQDAPLDDVRVLGVEQSNSSLVIDEQLFVKLYRRLVAGLNPELELLAFLGSHGFRNMPALRGSWSYEGPVLCATLGIVQDFVPAAVDGWALAVDELAREPQTFLDRVRRLGEVIGEMHAVLASDPDDPAFSPEEASPESLALLTATVDEDIDQLFLHLPEHGALAPIAGRGDAVRDLLRTLTTVGTVGRRIRHHGDLHLGQMLWAKGDWLVLDFEGEPARSLTERHAKRSPLRDVAGMLRSFTYAASVAGVGGQPVEDDARAEFLAGYMAAVRPSGLLPPPETTDRLLRIFELEKAVYELRYELAHRPDWVPVPVAGIVRMLDEAA